VELSSLHQVFENSSGYEPRAIRATKRQKNVVRYYNTTSDNINEKKQYKMKKIKFLLLHYSLQILIIFKKTYLLDSLVQKNGFPSKLIKIFHFRETDGCFAR
jgi:hypothetical protein